jgi:hypothetical protein
MLMCRQNGDVVSGDVQEKMNKNHDSLLGGLNLAIFS